MDTTRTRVLSVSRSSRMISHSTRYTRTGTEKEEVIDEDSANMAKSGGESSQSLNCDRAEAGQSLTVPEDELVY